MEFLMPPHPLTNFEIHKYYQNDPRFTGVFSRNNLPKNIKDEAYVINLDEYADLGTHCTALFCSRNEIIYSNSFGVEHVPEEIKDHCSLNSSTWYRPFSSASQNKNIKANIFSSTSKRFSNVSVLLHCIY